MKIIQPGTVPLIPVRRDEAHRRITIFLTQFPTGEKRNFRCVNCSRIIFQYESEVGLIMDSGDSPKEKAPIELLCHQCKIRYFVLW